MEYYMYLGLTQTVTNSAYDSEFHKSTCDLVVIRTGTV